MLGKERRGKKPLELAGVKFGQLTAIERHGHQGRRITWKCLCDCGQQKITTVDNLKSGRTRSCGCLRDAITSSLRDGQNSTLESCSYILYKEYVRNAKNRNHGFGLSLEEFKTITQQSCHYCGINPSAVTKKTKNGTAYTYNGIDRKDNSIGYVFSNCLPCCSFCNVAKHKKSYDEFISWLKRAGRYQNAGI